MALCCHLNPSDIVPHLESLTAFLFVGMRVQAIASRAEMVSDGATSREKALSMAGRREAAHLSFPLSSRLVRIFCLVIQAFMLLMLWAVVSGCV
jgi:hypothetical protein